MGSVTTSVLVVAALLVQFTNFVHLAAKTHVACEHGDLVEIESPAPNALFATAENSSLKTAWRAEANHEHDHCLLSPLKRDRAAVKVNVHVSLDNSLPPTPSVTLAHQGSLQLISVILLAPKNSPPTRS